ncbi:hypothetical protein HMPREF2657_04085 [Corynebacterium sp. HMSC072B08]|uniref:Eco47II family restriction endonuclease n=1 Tax=Corynebacterium sp. HMSC072B08 TaxID=1715136 RepID=UPI0008A8E409|nr:Eco47II family restriction endonuclease [Corynebacterium sp. HMSC072B08]OHQ64273.1 hypothetical protein HMPREF2657_04085 [Corynebacterium sp. HMSC072B08]
MSNTVQPRDLSWITYDQLLAIAEKRFSKFIRNISVKKNSVNDPTLVLALATFLDQDIDSVREMLAMQGQIKTLQNSIGLFHQDVLGSATGWRELGTNGGVLDIESEAPVALAGDRIVIAEVKMRYNTIKGSDQPKVFNKLKEAVAVKGGYRKYVSYLVQIIPEKPVAYDKLWKVTGNETHESVRVIDGRSAYHLVSGDPNAIDDLFELLPTVFDEVARKIDPDRAGLTTALTEGIVEQALAKALPKESALLK